MLTEQSTPWGAKQPSPDWKVRVGGDGSSEPRRVRHTKKCRGWMPGVKHEFGLVAIGRTRHVIYRSAARTIPRARPVSFAAARLSKPWAHLNAIVQNRSEMAVLVSVASYGAWALACSLPGPSSPGYAVSRPLRRTLDPCNVCRYINSAPECSAWLDFRSDQTQAFIGYGAGFLCTRSFCNPI